LLDIKRWRWRWREKRDLVQFLHFFVVLFFEEHSANTKKIIIYDLRWTKIYISKLLYDGKE
jgi:hypothetical protein